MEIVGDNIKEQTSQVFKNISTVLEGLNLTLSNIVKTTVYLKSMNDFSEMNKIYEVVAVPPPSPVSLPPP